MGLMFNIYWLPLMRGVMIILLKTNANFRMSVYHDHHCSLDEMRGNTLFSLQGYILEQG